MHAHVAGSSFNGIARVTGYCCRGLPVLIPSSKVILAYKGWLELDLGQQNNQSIPRWYIDAPTPSYGRDELFG